MFERFTKSARVAVVIAQEEARDAGAERITPVHLMLGVLDSADGALKAELADIGLTADAVRESSAGRVLTDSDADALQGIGIDVSAVADAVSDRFGFDIRRPIRKRFQTGNIAFGPGAKKTLKLALREAVHRKDRSIGAEHVLLGVIRSDDPDALAAIAAVIEKEQLRGRLYGLLDSTAA
ncbi:Clp protease N-terminal domain-containing protein [Tsukamurella sp. 1534]|uniref:Clp protease N-terminal domain-containing protein n=1 Tax=Tsukamurella sp. 1534 TaxID=1151061 RepID=UPI000302B5BA|nr:Clp protease N-terminal domain-containing protein [Tsukamurella sp. 1534]